MTHEENPEEDKDEDRKPGEEIGKPGASRGVLHLDVHIMLAENLDQIIELGGSNCLEGGSVGVFSLNLVAGDLDFAHVVAFYLGHEFAEIDLFFHGTGRL